MFPIFFPQKQENLLEKKFDWIIQLMVTQLYLKEILITSNTSVDKLTTIDFMY
jgi:hypothetical protein